jgi:hypothetical protein
MNKTLYWIGIPTIPPNITYNVQQGHARRMQFTELNQVTKP